MVQDVQIKKRNRIGNGDRSDYIHRISNFMGKFGKSDYRLIGGRSSCIVCQETAGRFHDNNIGVIIKILYISTNRTVANFGYSDYYCKLSLIEDSILKS